MRRRFGTNDRTCWCAAKAGGSISNAPGGCPTKVRSPRTNGFVERMNRTLLDECFRVKDRETV
ncbi:MAG: hypothetical protein DPW14_17275 [Planctomycetes bacterium]|nr:hypothetical protein [Planctomycetota bacterium]